MDDEAAYHFLKEHDPKWLSHTLQERSRALLQEQKQHQHAKSIGENTGRGDATTTISLNSSALTVGPFDLTAPTLPSGLHVSEHIRFVRGYDWASTPLGPMSTWPPELRRMVNFTLADSRSAALWWGEKRIAIYNEAYVGVVSSRHPAALGSSVFDVWPELVDTPYGHSLDLADQTGRPSSGERGVYFVSRSGYLEEVWASWNMIPVLGSTGNLGCYNTVSDETQDVINDRRMSTLQSLDASLSQAEEVRSFWSHILQGIEHSHDEIPFAAVYGPSIGLARQRSMQHDGSQPLNEVDIDDSASHSDTASSIFTSTEWTLEGIVGFAPSDGISLPQNIDQESGTELLTSSFVAAMNSRKPSVLTLAEHSPRLRGVAKSRKYDGEPCRTIIFLPIRAACEEHRSGFMLLGLSTRQTYDAAYRRFVAILHLQLTNAFNTIVLAEIEARRARTASRLAAKDRMRLVQRLSATEHEAQSNEMRFKSMADLAPVGIFTFDSRGNLLYANQNFFELTGQSREALREGVALSDALLDADRAAFSAQWQDLLAGKAIHFQCRLNRPYSTNTLHDAEKLEGETWVLIAAYAIGNDTLGARNDVVEEVFGCMLDISKQKWIESFQERQIKLQKERTRQQENFMDSTSHEARNPLAAITLCADDLHTTLTELTSRSSAERYTIERDTVETLLDDVDIIISCARHQKRIIDDVLTLSKLDSGMLTTSPSREKPTDLVAQALRMFQVELKRNDVELAYTIADSYGKCEVEYVMLDGTRFLQVLINLLSNAIKFTKREVQRRRITVTLKASRIRPTSEDHDVTFVPVTGPEAVPVPYEWPEPSQNEIFLYVSITDTGPGIAEGELENLFQRFQQASPKTYAQYGGSGLGLWISKELCFKLGGQVGVASSRAQGGQGSTFAFYVQAPMCPPPAVAASNQTAVKPPSVERAISSVKGQITRDELEWKQPAGLQQTSTTAAPDIVNNAAKHRIDSPSSNITTGHATTTTVSTITTNSTVLVVEDNLINQRVMRKQLGRAGFDVLVANHGKEALEILDREITEPAVILMDIEMPVMGGLECTKLIRAREQKGGGALPILGVTANVRAEQQAAAIEAGMDLVVTKPFHMKEVLDAIERVRREREMEAPG